MDKQTVRYGVIGFGNMGGVHARQIFAGNVSFARLTAICDISEEKIDEAKEEFGNMVNYYRDYKQLLLDKVCDAVIIATPHYSHPAIAVESFKANLHVLCEKPAGVEAEMVKSMNAYAKLTGKKFAMMFNQRMNPVFSTLKYYVDLGVLGEIKQFTWIINNWYRTQHYYDSAGWRATWKGEGGGVLINQCPHNLDIWQWIMGMPEEIRAWCSEGKYHHIDVEDEATIFAEYKNGASAVFISSTGYLPGTNRLEISGTMGKAVCEEGVIKLTLLKEDEREICFNSKESMPIADTVSVTLKPAPLREEHLMVIDNFTRHILFDEELVAPGEDGINSLQISNAAYLSSWTKKTVKVPVDSKKFSRMLRNKKDTVRKAGSSKEKNLAADYAERWRVRW